MENTLPNNALNSNRKDLFVDEYLKTFNQTTAAINAGYSENGARTRGSLLMKDIVVQQLLKVRMAERQEQTLYDQMFVIEGLKEVCSRCLQKKPTGKGSYKFDARGALRALELLGKTLGMFNGKLESIGLDQPWKVQINVVQEGSQNSPSAS